jgi:antitoxin (DNA-binding transcriptional repressor) of toxin-antitoxin stability system
MTTVTLEEAQARLPEIIQHLQPGEEITITDQGQPLAQVKKSQRASRPASPPSAKPTRPGPGLCKGEITYMAPDFDAPLEVTG